MNRCGTVLGWLEKCPETLQTLKWGRVRPKAHLWSGPHHLMSCVMSVPLGSMESGGAGPQRNGLPQSWQPHQRGSGSPAKQLGCPLLAIAPSAPTTGLALHPVAPYFLLTLGCKAFSTTKASTGSISAGPSPLCACRDPDPRQAAPCTLFI